ncbi:MAG: sigma-70 family RNA polymerase sigma factor [Vulcanimicrobiaceae bacterium]
MTGDSRENVIRDYVADPTIENRNAVVDAHRYLCRRGARKFYRGTVDRNDLEQVAAIGLIKAANRYSRDYETPFEAYAWLMVVGELMHFVRDHERVVRIPRRLRALEARYREVYEKLAMALSREPTTSELAAELGVAVETIGELRNLRSQRLTGDDDDDGGNWIGDRYYTAAVLPDEISGIDERLTLATALQQLSERERNIVYEIFFRRNTQAEVGERLGISQRQVSRVLTRTLQRLARFIAA